VSVFAILCEIYVLDAIRDTAELLNLAVQSRESGDYPLSREYTETAWEKWRALTNKSNYVLADLTIASDITISLSRVMSLSEGNDDERFKEECKATVMYLEHFMADNHNVISGADTKK
jgi:hypothetical protein